MILTAHQPVYLPWLGLFHKISLADIFVYFDQVQYLPKDWMNRNEIKTATGPSWLTVPVLKKGHRERKTSEIEINNEIDWRKKHLKTIKNNYCKSPFFEKYLPPTWGEGDDGVFLLLYVLRLFVYEFVEIQYWPAIFCVDRESLSPIETGPTGSTQLVCLLK